MRKLLSWSVNRRFNFVDVVYLSFASELLSKGHFLLWIAIIIAGTFLSVAMEHLSKRVEKSA